MAIPSEALKIIGEAAKWLPLAWQLREAFGGDMRKARAQVRKWELEQRAARDRRMGR